ncbi:MAG: GNAT family N-acetyltransferase [Clostridiales bacterium]|nr:GNAT family N-acetyltransferase [Clostridiales bacterium]
MTKIYIVRHAEAEGNLYRRIHGHYDSLVTPRGMEQIKALEKRFESIPIDAVYSSDLTRTRTTAGAIYIPKGLPLNATPALREVGMGVWEDDMWGHIEEDYAEQYRYYNTCPDKWDIPGCEHWDHLCRRISSAMLDIAAMNPGKTVAAVSHGCAIRALMSVILGIPASEISRIQYCDNTAVSLITVEDGKMQLEFMNDSSHLPDELTAFRHETWWKSEKATDGRNMRIEPFDVAANKERYLARYRDAWIISHGSDKGFSDIYYDWAVMRSMKNARAVAEAKLGGKPAGMIELAPESGEKEGYGHIAFLCMDEEYRFRGLGVQLIGHAVSFYRPLGRKKLRLNVAADNKNAIKFYTKYGFTEVKREEGGFGEVIVMEKGIALP